MASLLMLLAFLSYASAVGILYLKEGEVCKNGSPPSYCKLHTSCTGVQEAIKKGQFPDICSFKGRNNPIVCCLPSYANAVTRQPPNPTNNSRPQSLKAGEMCKKYAKYVWKTIPAQTLLQKEEKRSYCGRAVDPLIVNGVPADPMEFPHMARIGYGEQNKIEWLCGGSLISERFILSAAHCTNPGQKGPASWANLGDLDVSTDFDNAQPVTIKIIERFNHPEYKADQLYHDIALYKLEKDAPLGIYIRPICLNTDITIKYPRAIASGWGRTFWASPESDKLLKVKLDIASHKRCTDAYRSDIGPGLELPRGIVPDYMICAGGVGENDTCQGDSGGPLQVPLETPFCMYSIIGVTSFGKRCGYGFPGVYTNVAYYAKWIEDKVWP